MPPHPNDLFMNLWAREINDEDTGLRPGTELWEANKLNARNHWVKVWIECKELSRAIQDFESLTEQCGLAITEPEPEDTA